MPTDRQNARNRGKNFERLIVKKIYTGFKNSDYPPFKEIEHDEVHRNSIPPPPGEHCDISYKKGSSLLPRCFPWAIECKNVRSIPPLEKLMVKRHASWQKCWEQCVDQALLMKLYPLLIWRTDPKFPILCAITPKLMYFRDDDNLMERSQNQIFSDVSKGIVRIYNFDTFLSNIIRAGRRLDKNKDLSVYETGFLRWRVSRVVLFSIYNGH